VRLPNDIYAAPVHVYDMPRATVSSVESYRELSDGVALDCVVTHDDDRVGKYALPERNVPVEIRFYTDSVFRFEFHAHPETAAETDGIDLRSDNLRKEVDVSVSEGDGDLHLTTHRLRLTIGLDEWSFEVTDREGRILLTEQRRDQTAKTETRARPLGYDEELVNRWPYRSTNAGTSFTLRSDEHVLGLGEKFIEFDKRGQRVESWVTQPNGSESEAAYKNVPFYLSTRGYGLLVDTVRKVTFDVGASSSVSTQVSVDDDSFQYVFFHGPSFKTILDNYTALTGRPGRVPKWSLGVWMSRLGYESREELEAVTDRLREEEMPCDVVHLDPPWLADSRLCDLEWDREAFPDPEGMIEDLHDRGFRLSLWEYPYLLTRTHSIEEAFDRGYLVNDAGGSPYLLGRLSWGGDRGGIVDFTNPEAREWWKEKHRDLVEMGVDVFKTDFGEYLPGDAILHNGKSGRAMRNYQAHRYTQTVYEAIEEADPDRTPLLWARPGWAGGQQYPVHWGGDPNTTFEAMASSLRGGLSLLCSGYAFWSADIGGFHGEPSRELYIRWAQFGLLGNSHARFHGTTPREPWHYGEEAANIVRRYAEERYRLLPYLYSYAERAPETGLPVVRPLVLEFQTDRAVYDIADQLMLGENILVAPVLTEDGQVEVYLPDGEWVDYWNGDRYRGGRTLRLVVDLDKMPVFVRAGSIVPTSEPTLHVPDEPAESVDLRVVLKRGEETHARFGYADETTDGAVTVECDADADHAEVSFGLPPDLDRRRFGASVENLDRVPETVSLDGEALTRVAGDPGPGEWTVTDDGGVSATF
jgi:alpha-D-xyloside xylohydrolase